jgi:hypothetical protein
LGTGEGAEKEKANHREHGGKEKTQRLAEKADALARRVPKFLRAV